MTEARRARFLSRYGPWAVVTGASSGIGRAIAIEVAATGTAVVLVARREERLRALARELETQAGVYTRIVIADLATSAGIEAVEAAARDLDVGLYVGAAGFGTSGPFLGALLAREEEMLDVNCRAMLAHASHFGNRFAQRGRGGLVLMASLVGFQGVPYAAHYAATKAYVQTLAEGLHVELAPLGVDVLASAPGPVRSGFADRADMRMGATLAPLDVARATLGALGRRTTVVPGLLSKVLTYSLSPLVRTARSRVMGGVMYGMTKHQTGNQSGVLPEVRLP